jgi:hypothetical protein
VNQLFFFIVISKQSRNFQLNFGLFIKAVSGNDSVRMALAGGFPFQKILSTENWKVDLNKNVDTSYDRFFCFLFKVFHAN